MPDEKKTPEVPPKRTRERVQADLDAAKARLRQLHPEVERENARARAQEQRIDKARARWLIERPDEPFDPDAFAVSLRPHAPDPALQAEFHRQHYIINGLEDELNLPRKAER